MSKSVETVSGLQLTTTTSSTPLAFSAQAMFIVPQSNSTELPILYGPAPRTMTFLASVGFASSAEALKVM